MVYFIGAGPGAPDLISVRGAKLLQKANVIIYAGSLVNPDLLNYANDECLIYNSATMNLDEVIEVILNNDASNKTIVRLHTGDPSIYGAHKEQMDILQQHNVQFEVVPGISSFCGAAAVLNAELTLPGVSQTVILTRVEGRTKVPEMQNIKSLASHQATMVLFLSMSLIDKLVNDLVAGGYSLTTPAAIVYKATWPDQKIFRTTLKDLKEVVVKNNITKTALVIVGAVLDTDYELSKLYDKSFTHEFRQGIDD